METLVKPRPNGVAQGTPRAICVWLVEDNHAFRMTVARVLNGIDGIECFEHFSNAEDALELLQSGDSVPDVILMDLGLPGQNGIVAISKIKAILPSTRVVVLTVFDQDEKVFKAICAGASGYLLKSTPPDAIVEAIHEALAGGAPMTPKVAKAVLQMFSQMGKPVDYGLTERERNVLELMTKGLTAKAIAGQLDVSYHTVDTHIRNIYTKLHVHSRGSAVAKGFREKLFS